MSITRRDCYELKCDGCGYDWGGDFIPHFQCDGDALDYLHDHDGEEVDGKHLCEECVQKRKAALPDQETKRHE